MKMMKIYGMHGLLEWHGHVHTNGVSMKCDFTNGSTTAYGVAPATFITKDVVTQTLMENSREFKSGRIKLLRAVELPGEGDEKPSGEPEGGARGLEEAEGAAESKDEEAVTKTFACNDDAKDYMVETYNVSPSKMRSRADIEKVASENGVKIIWG